MKNAMANVSFVTPTFALRYLLTYVTSATMAVTRDAASSVAAQAFPMLISAVSAFNRKRIETDAQRLSI